MKYVFILVLFVGIVNANEIKRIESIVEDITKLRAKYSECQSTLLSSKKDLSTSEYDRIQELEKEIKNYKNILKAKDKEIVSLKNDTKKKTPAKKQKVEVCEIITYDKPNDFPNLSLKDKYINENILRTTPSTYRLNKNAHIYASIDGKKIEAWEKDTSFTSNYKNDSWVKITGFFINRVWVKSESQMWIPLSDVRKR